MNFYVTFSQVYRHKPHPTDLNAHPDGYFLIVADNVIKAVEVANDFFDRYWLSLHSEDNMDFSKFPLGCLGKID